MMDRHILSNSYLSAAVKSDGAELCSLRDAEGTELLWQAHPVWPRHAPVLFPIVGRLKDDTLVHHGKALPADAAWFRARPAVRLAEPHRHVLPAGAARRRRDPRGLPVRVSLRGGVRAGRRCAGAKLHRGEHRAGGAAGLGGCASGLHLAAGRGRREDRACAGVRPAGAGAGAAAGRRAVAAGAPSRPRSRIRPWRWRLRCLRPTR